MRVVILGSGVIGVTSAWYLMAAGHEVVVLEKLTGSGLETSAGNAGQISPGYAAPWAAPGIPLKAIKWLFQKHAPLAIRPDFTLFQLQWMWQMLLNCSSRRYKINKARMVRLAEYSRDCLDELREETNISYEGRQAGTIQLFRTKQQYDNAARDIEILKEAGVPYQLLESHQLEQYEPALARVQDKLTGGLRLPHDETGDCQLFTQCLAQLAEQAGVSFRYDCSAERLLSEQGKIVGIQCQNNEVIRGDCYVVALGTYSTHLLHGLINIPVYPLKGYSLTLPIVDSTAAPVSTILDETYKIAITRFNERIRVGGMAEIVGYDLQLKLKKRQTLEMVVSDLYPNGGDLSAGTFWTGLRPMTPDGTPIVGRTKLANLYLNTGHGTLGWTMACGSGKLLADLITGKATDIFYDDLSILRYTDWF